MTSSTLRRKVRGESLLTGRHHGCLGVKIPRADATDDAEWTGDAERRFDRLLDDIRSLRIQGAERVARAAVEALARYHGARGKIPSPLVDRLLATRPTEPMLRNAVRYYLDHAAGQDPLLVARHLLQEFDIADERIAHYAAAFLKEGGLYFTHCHSSTVVAALLAAWRDGRQFSVHNTETRPLFQGRITAEDLVRAGIPVTHFVDSASRVALKGCGAVFLGADALLADGTVVNKIGSEVIAELAENRRIPVYVLASSWKYAPVGRVAYKRQLEKRPAREVWPDAPRGVTVENPAFELVHPRRITAIITEQGIAEPLTCAHRLRHRWRRLLPTETSA